jgi:hypothetical protein
VGLFPLEQRLPCAEPFLSRNDLVRFHGAFLSSMNVTTVGVAPKSQPAGTFLTDEGFYKPTCGRVAGVGCAQLCSVVPTVTGAPLAKLLKLRPTLSQGRAHNAGVGGSSPSFSTRTHGTVGSPRGSWGTQ